jgi:hypothetical protein
MEVSPVLKTRAKRPVTAGMTPSGMNITTTPSRSPAKTRCSGVSPYSSLEYSSPYPAITAPSSGPYRWRTPPSSAISTM